MNWLDEAMAECTLTEEVEGYLLGRGAKESSIAAEGIITWRPTKSPVPNPEFVQKYGSYGQKLDGFLMCPIKSPKGTLIGFEARNIRVKVISDFRLPEAKWNPFFVGTRAAMPAIWAGGNVWICEGMFDKFPLEWAVPPGDAVLATVRAKLSDAHIEFLRRFCKGTVNMVYDRDETGIRATGKANLLDMSKSVLDRHKATSVGWKDPETGKTRYGALAVLNRIGLKCRYVQFRGGKDPGEIWDHGGASAIQAAIQQAVVVF